MYAGGILLASNGPRERLFERAFGAGARSRPGQQRETLLATEGLVAVRKRLKASRILQCAGKGASDDNEFSPEKIHLPL